MLEKITIVNENPYMLGFFDEYSPRGWKSLINHKLSEYKESAYIDSTVDLDKLFVILELNPKNQELNSEYIKKEKKQFKEYYKRILEDIENSEFYDILIV